MTPLGLGPLAPNFDAALRDVRARDAKFREAAALVLAGASERLEEAREGLRTLLDDELGPIRAVAVEGLGEIGDSFDGPVLLAMLEDPHISVRAACWFAACKLARRADDDAQESIEKHALPCLEDEASLVRCSALRTLELIGSARWRSAAELALDDPSDDVRTTAVTLLEGNFDGESDIAQLLRRASAADAGWESTRNAALALARHDKSDGRTETVLLHALRDPSWRLAAIDGLRSVSSQRSADALAALGERLLVDLVTRAAVGEALAERKDERAIPILRTVLRAWRADGRDYALRAVATHTIRSLKAEVLSLLKRRRGASASALAEALEALGEHESAAAVRAIGTGS